jgi:hypothetical protein
VVPKIHVEGLTPSSTEFGDKEVVKLKIRPLGKVLIHLACDLIRRDK